MSTGATCARFLLIVSLVTVFGLAPAAYSQDPLTPQGPAQDDLALRRAALAGYWTLHPYREGTPPPPPPPYASQRSEQDKLPPLESVARVKFQVQASGVTGSAVFPTGIVLTDQNQDVTGLEPVNLEKIEFDGEMLKFEAVVDGKRFQAELQSRGSRFFGTWVVAGEEMSGDLYLVRRR